MNMKKVKDSSTNYRKYLEKALDVDFGIFDGSSQRSDGGATNAQLLAIHEDGSITRGIPRRSVLRNTINVKKDSIAKIAKENILKGNLDASKVVGAAVLSFRLEAFQTKGFGTWQELDKKTIKRKNGKTEILQDTVQMARSLDVRIK